MAKVFCLMGRSATGKDTIYNKLLEIEELKLKKVIPYTTRPIRSGEIDGVSYYFCTDQEADKMHEDGRVIEMRTYHTVHGPWRYFTVDDGQIKLDGPERYLMIGTLDVYESLMEYYGSENVVPIYVWIDKGILLERALKREREQENPKYAEMCRRFLGDEEDFKEERLERDGIVTRFENIDLEKVLKDIACYIERS